MAKAPYTLIWLVVKVSVLLEQIILHLLRVSTQGRLVIRVVFSGILQLLSMTGCDQQGDSK